MLSKIAIFILFLGPLVFFHELGHFLFARLFGVRVEVFSIGFGPKILKYKRGVTEYVVSLIPLGGYVKMFGDDPLAKEEMPEAQRKYSFVHKSKMARFWIVFGGPLANFILAYCIFFTLFMTGEKVPEIKIGPVKETTEFYKMGIRSGDVIKKVNGKSISSPGDIILETDGNLKSLVVDRSGKDISVSLDLPAEKFLEKMSEYPPLLVQPIFKSTDGNLYGLSQYEGKVDWGYSLDEMLTTPLQEYYLHTIKKLDRKTMKNEIDLTIPAKRLKVIDGDLYKTLRESNLYPIDLVVRDIVPKSAAEKAGIKSGDTITKIDGNDVYSFDSLRNLIQNGSQKTLKLDVLRKDEMLSFTLNPEIKTISGKEVRLIGIYPSSMYLRGKYINTEPLSIGEATVRSWNRTIQTVYKTVEGFKKLIFAETSFKNIGGPITIGKVASDSFNTSLSYFFQLMALISVNLGVINLFPIPVLDGGHIVFIILEALNGGPLSRRKLEIAQQFGLSLLLLLMVGALFNDFTRIF